MSSRRNKPAKRSQTSNMPKRSGQSSVKNGREQNQILAMHAEQHFSGPIPPPDLFRQYDEVLPGAADRILALTEKQTNHRIEIEKSYVAANNRNSLIGVIFAGVIGVFGVGGGAVGVIMGRGAEAISALVVSLAALCGVFIYGKQKENRSRKVDE